MGRTAERIDERVVDMPGQIALINSCISPFLVLRGALRGHSRQQPLHKGGLPTKAKESIDLLCPEISSNLLFIDVGESKVPG